MPTPSRACLQSHRLFSVSSDSLPPPHQATSVATAAQATATPTSLRQAGCRHQLDARREAAATQGLDGARPHQGSQPHTRKVGTGTCHHPHACPQEPRQGAAEPPGPCSMVAAVMEAALSIYQTDYVSRAAPVRFLQHPTESPARQPPTCQAAPTGYCSLLWECSDSGPCSGQECSLPGGSSAEVFLTPAWHQPSAIHLLALVSLLCCGMTMPLCTLS